MHRLSRSLTYANVMATIAVFIALGGASYAAVKLPENSVGTTQIKKEAITPSKLSKAAKATLTGPSGSEGATGMQGKEGRQGPEGKEGLPGEDGLSGLTDVVVRSKEVAVPTDNLESAAAECHAEEVAVSGGIELVGGLSEGVRYLGSGLPLVHTDEGTPYGWNETWINDSGETDTFEVYVLCSSPSVLTYAPAR